MSSWFGWPSARRPTSKRPCGMRERCSSRWATRSAPRRWRTIRNLSRGQAGAGRRGVPDAAPPAAGAGADEGPARGRPVGTDLGAVTGPGRELGYREPGLSRRPRPRRRLAAADLSAAQRIAETDSRTLDRVMPTVSRLAHRGFGVAAAGLFP